VKKRIFGMALLCACLLTGPAYGAEVVAAQGCNTVVLVNGVAQEIYPYNIEGNNYFKLRELAVALANTNSSFAVEWDGEKEAINLNTMGSTVLDNIDLQFPAGETVKEAEASAAALYCDGQPVDIHAYNIEGNNYFKLRDIGEVLGFSVAWDDEVQLMEIDTNTVTTSTATQGYSTIGAADGSGIELDESFTNPDYWDTLPAFDVEVEPEAGQDWEEEEPPTGQTGSRPNTGVVQTDVQQLLNGAELRPKYTQFAVLNSLIDDFVAKNFNSSMDTYTKVRIAYDYFIQNMTYETATQLDMGMFSKEEAAVIWQHYPERYAVPILLDHKGVCNHYSSAYAAILQAIGLDVQVVSGKTKSSAGGYSSHVWVTVRIDGVDYLFDPQVEQRIAQRNGNVIQYYRFGKAISALQSDYQADKQYQFADSL